MRDLTILSNAIDRRAWLSSAMSLTCSSLALGPTAHQIVQDPASESRPPRDDEDLRAWLENMVAAHQFTLSEVQAATGLAPDAISAALKRFRIEPRKLPARPP